MSINLLRKKLNEFIGGIINYKSLSDSEITLFFSFFYTEILRKIEITTVELGQLYDLADLPVPQNFGGEIKKLLSAQKLIRTQKGYKLSRFAKEWVLSQIGQLKITPKEIFRKPVLSFESLHPLVRKVSKSLFDDGHYPQAIFEAYKAVVNEVKNVSGIKDLDGKPLMERVFSLTNPIVKFNGLQTQSEKDEQLGLMLLFAGATLGIRNPKAHDFVKLKDPIRALEYLVFASLLLKRLNERV